MMKDYIGAVAPFGVFGIFTVLGGFARLFLVLFILFFLLTWVAHKGWLDVVGGSTERWLDDAYSVMMDYFGPGVPDADEE